MDNPRYFDDYFFTSNVSGHTCPGFGSFECAPPAACARDPNTGRRYCCDTRDVCWTVTQTCAHDGSTTDCGTGDTTWCCVDGREICTRTRNQINICWSAAHDLLNNISLAVLNDTYSSLSNAHPSATTWAFDPVKLVAETEPALTASSSSTTATSPSSTSSSLPPGTVVASPTGGSDNHDNSHASSGLSGGAIAGIVIGVLAGVAALCAVAFVVLRRRRSRRQQTTNNAAAIAAAAATGGPPGGPTGMAHNPSSSYGGDGSIATSLDNKLRYAAVPQFDAAAGGGGGYAPYDASTPGSSPPPPPPSSGLGPQHPGFYAATPSSGAVSALHSDTNGPQELPGGGVQHPFELPAHSPP